MNLITNNSLLKQLIVPLIWIVSIFGIMITTPMIITEEGTTDTMLAMKMDPVNANVIRPFLFGHEAFYADLFWIHCIRWSQEQGMLNMFEYLDHMTNLIVDLDPRFEQVYIWAGLNMSYAYSAHATNDEKIIAVNKILQKGWNYIQQDTDGWNHFFRFWMIPQLLSYNYGVELGNHEKALEYNRALMSVPGLPAFMKTWVATTLKDQNQAETGKNYMENLLAVETLQAQLSMTDDEVVKDKLKGKLLFFYRKLHSDKYGEKRMQEIQEEIRVMVETWRKSYSYLPFPLYTLIHLRITSEEMRHTDYMYQMFLPTLGGL